MIYLGAYLLVVIISEIFLSKFWKYEEGEWEFDDNGDIFEVDKEYHKHRILMLSLFWPLTISLSVLVLLIKGISYPIDRFL